MRNSYSSIWGFIILLVLMVSGIKVYAQYVPVYDNKGKVRSVADRAAEEARNKRIINSNSASGSRSVWEVEYDRKEQMKQRKAEAREKMADDKRAADAERAKAAMEEKEFKARYREIGAPDENGLRMVTGLRGNYGFVNQDNIEIICTCYEGYNYANGYYGLNLSGSWGFVDKEGKTVVPFLYDKIIRGFETETATVMKNGRNFLIDKQGNEIVNKTIAPVKSEAAYVSKNTPNKPEVATAEKAAPPKAGTADYNEGFEKFKQKDFKGAVTSLNKAVRINPNHEMAWFYRGMAKDELKDYTGAIADYDKTIYLQSDFPGAYYNRGLARYELKDYAGTIADMTKAVRVNPKDFNAYFKRAIAKTKINDKTGAILDYTKAIELNPGYVNAYFNRANQKYDLKDFAGAVSDYTKVVALDSGHAGAYFYRASAKYELKDFIGTIADCTKAIELNPKDEQSYYLRGSTKLLVTSKGESACTDLKRALSLGSSVASAAIKMYCN